MIEGGPLILFGHSLGALLAFEVARELRRRGVAVSSLLVSGCRAPHLPDRYHSIRHLPTSSLAKELASRYDAAPELVDDLELMEILGPAIRADLALVETYRFVPEAPLDCPIFAYRGREDSALSEDEIHGWRLHTSSDCLSRSYRGSHRFPRQVPSPLCELVQADVLAILGDDTETLPRVESDLAALWQEILGVERVGTRDDFFAQLGGNSLLATRMVAHVRTRYGVELPLKTFFDAPTIEEMSKALVAPTGDNLTA
jgi:acyl carrier protein